MTVKNNFIKAFNRLSKNDGPIVKQVITSMCKLGGPSLFYMKMRDPSVVGPQKSRPILECNQYDIDEITVIESVFRCFGLDAWTGERLSFGTLTHESPLTKIEELTQRLKLQGLSRKEIAEKVFRSHYTIRTHINKAYAKIDVHSDIELSNWYLENILSIGIKKLLEDKL